MSGVRDAVRAFLDEGPQFAQLVTVDAHDRPVVRTVGAEVDADWTVTLVARAGHARHAQLQRNPHLQLVFVAPPRSTDPVAQPAVIDYGLPVPRVVALRGTSEPMSPADTLSAYRRQTAAARSTGNCRAPERSDDDVLAELAGTRVRVDRVRAEGFGDGALAETWNPRPSARGTS